MTNLIMLEKTEVCGVGITEVLLIIEIIEIIKIIKITELVETKTKT